MQENLGFIPGGAAPLEEEMVNHSSLLAWRIPWMEEPGELQSLGSRSQTRLSRHTHKGRSRQGPGEAGSGKLDLGGAPVFKSSWVVAFFQSVCLIEILIPTPRESK